MILDRDKMPLITMDLINKIKGYCDKRADVDRNVDMYIEYTWQKTSCAKIGKIFNINSTNVNRNITWLLRRMIKFGAEYEYKG